MPDSGEWLTTAEVLARHLAASAHVYDGECTWLGTTQAAEEDSDDPEFTHASLGPDLYGGTSGVALFLAEASVRLDDRVLRTRAEEAIRHALARSRAHARPDATGFYVGSVGVAYAAARIGRLLGRNEYVDGALSLVADLDAGGPTSPVDLIAGSAGTAPVLPLLAEWCDAPGLRASARALGDHLLERATRHASGGWSWGEPGDEDDGSPHLTGFSHGAAGIGWSLLRLHRATAEERYLAGALAAFEYENRWFLSEVGNWADLRDASVEDHEFACGAAWCHGAPGIGLSRLRAMEVSALAAHRRDARMAVASCMSALAVADEAPDADGSLCHGRAGLVDIALTLADALADQTARGAALSSAALAAERYGHRPAEWPIGVAQGSNPSLMLGLAGVGYGYLRLADRSLDSVLEPGG